MKKPLAVSDLVEVEQLLEKRGVGGLDDIRHAAGRCGLGLFVRSLIGMDRGTAKDGLAGFIKGKTFTVTQLEMVNLVVDHLTEHGIMEPARLYESPFTDLMPRGPDGLFKATDIDELIQTLEVVRATAVAA